MGGLTTHYNDDAPSKYDGYWIASVVPRPTPEQLKAIGMRERDDRPVEIKDGDRTVMIFDDTAIDGYGESCEFDIGKFRWVLMPVEKEAKNKHQGKFCQYNIPNNLEAARELLDTLQVQAWFCEDGTISIPTVEWDQAWQRASEKTQPAHICTDCTTPAILCPNANEPKDKVKECGSKNLKWPLEKGVGDGGSQADEEAAHTSSFAGLCPSCLLPVYHRSGKPGEYDHTCDAPAPSPAPAQDEPKFTVEEIIEWLATLPLPYYAIMHINDPQDGIAAATQKQKGE
jgi:hypothetical protein